MPRAGAVNGASAASAQQLKGLACILISGTGFGIMVLFTRTAAKDGVDPASVLFLRLALAAVVLALMAWWQGAIWPRGRALRVPALMGVLLFANTLAYYHALDMGAAAKVAAVFFTAYPIVVAALTCWRTRRMIALRTAACIALSVTGCWLTISPQDGAPLSWLSLELAVVSATFYSGYVMLSGSLDRSATPIAQVSLITISAALCMVVMVSWRGLHLPVSLVGWGCVLALALFSTVVAFTAFLAGARILGPTTAAALSAVEPALTALTAWACFGEALGPWSWLGMALVTGSVVLSSWR